IFQTRVTTYVIVVKSKLSLVTHPGLLARLLRTVQIGSCCSNLGLFDFYLDAGKPIFQLAEYLTFFDGIANLQFAILDGIAVYLRRADPARRHVHASVERGSQKDHNALLLANDC